MKVEKIHDTHSIEDGFYIYTVTGGNEEISLNDDSVIGECKTKEDIIARIIGAYYAGISYGYSLCNDVFAEVINGDNTHGTWIKPKRVFSSDSGE